MSSRNAPSSPGNNRRSGSGDGSASGSVSGIQIPFEFTVPSQEEEYRATRMGVHHPHPHRHQHQHQSHHQQQQQQSHHHHQHQHHPHQQFLPSPRQHSQQHLFPLMEMERERPSSATMLTPVGRKRPYEDEEDDEEEMDEEDDEEGDEYLPEWDRERRGSSHLHQGGGGGIYTSATSLGKTRTQGQYELSISSMEPSGRVGGGVTASGSSSRAGADTGAGSSAGGNAKGKKVTMLGPDGQPPPKKKRRRQALSCTECKRRKIRCDRVKPCAPCSRRGEADKCHWNILEPVDKFVTRKEYDEIKDSLNRLQSILSNQSPSATTDPVEVAAVLNAVQSRASTVFAKMAGPGVPANNSSGTNTNTNANTNANTNVNKNKRTGSGGGTADPFMPMPPPPPLEGGGGRSNASSGSPPPSLSYPLSRPSRRSYSEAAAPSTALGSTSAATQSYAMGVPSQTVFPSPTNPFGVGMSVGVIQGYDDDRDDFLSHPTPQSTHFIPGSGPRKGSVSVATAVPEIHLGGLIVDDQSPTALVHPGMYNLNKLDALAKAAHSSPRSGLGMPMGSVDVDGRPASSSSKVTLAPIHANGLSPEVNGSSSTTGRFSPAPGVSMVMGGVGGRDSMSSKESEMRRVLETCLPRKEVCDRLVAHYFELVEWSITLLHYSRFMRTYQAFWLLSESERARLALCSLSPMQRGNSSGGGAGVRWGEGFRASFVPPPHATSADGTTAETPGSVGVNSNRTRTRDEASVVRSSWVALLFAVMCVALERMGFYDSKAIGINTVNEYHRQCRLLYDASQSVLVLSDFLKSSSLETIQTLVLHTHCPQSLSTADWETQTSVTLGLAFRLGFLQGLHKLMPEKMGSARTPGLLIREMGRRAWWNLIETDWRLSTRVGNTYVLHPNQNNCDLPANLEWEDLERARATFVQRERSVWTGASSLLARIDLALVRRELVDKYNAVDGVTYAQLAEHEKRLEEMVHRAPRQLFNIDGDFESQTPQGQWDRIQFTFLLNSDIIALHRPYLVTSLLEVKATGASPAVSQVTQYHRTLEISIRSAEAILDALEEAKATSYPGISWWQTSVQCHVAAVVLLIERWYTPEAKPGTLESEDADERKRKIVAAIGLLRDQGDSIEIFATAANALESLLDATTSARRKARRNARRAMDLNDVVNPVNSSRSQSAGNTPPFVRDWIERPNTPVPSSSESMVIIDRAPSLSTLSIFPGTPLVADTSYDSQFWSRIFDLEFVPPSEVREMYFPSVEIGEEDEGEMEGEAWTPTMQGVVHTEKAGERNTSLWQRTTTSKEGEEVEASSGTELGASAIWSSLSGPLGSLNADKEEWHRVTPYDLGGTTTTARG